MIVLDASVLIGYLDRGDGHHARATAVLEREVADTFGANSLTLAEVLVGPIRSGRERDVEAAIEALEIEELPFPDQTALELARLRVGTGLRLPDCCVLMAAESSRGRLATFDDRLRVAAERRGILVVEG